MFIAYVVGYKLATLTIGEESIFEVCRFQKNIIVCVEIYNIAGFSLILCVKRHRRMLGLLTRMLGLLTRMLGPVTS